MQVEITFLRIAENASVPVRYVALMSLGNEQRWGATATLMKLKRRLNQVPGLNWDAIELSLHKDAFVTVVITDAEKQDLSNVLPLNPPVSDLHS